ncbi:hypothetical protein B0H10DRAFT_2210565 [Mycena sp. CBHHK59/15]|nr:hypothetical protein B0H10DRAFT_2210565 [Mycena sp. CBHHK59/15]
MGDPPKTPPPFHGRTTRLPQTPISPFKFNASLSKAIPAGNFLIIHGVFEHGAKKINPVLTVELKVAKIWTSNLAVRDIPVVVSPLVSLDPKAEPCTELLHLWIEPLTALGWEVHWAQQIEGKDKQMWKYDKMITRLRADFDSSGLQTVNGFRSGSGVIITFTLPADIDAAVNERNIVFDSKTLPIYRVHQIEIGYAFELIIGSVASIDPTAINNVISWFADFERDGESLLVEMRTARGEARRLQPAPPQLLFRLNTTAAWKADPSAVITKGAKKVTGAITALTRRIETNEHNARTRDADTKTCLTTIDVNLTAVSTLTSALHNHQEKLAHSFFILQQDTQYTAALSCLDTSIMANRQTFMRPIDDTEKDNTRSEIERLTEERKLTQLKLDTLHATTNLTPTLGPLYRLHHPRNRPTCRSRPLALTRTPRSQLDDTTDNPAKRAHLSTAPKEGEAAAKNPATDEDYDMIAALPKLPL